MKNQVFAIVSLAHLLVLSPVALAQSDDSAFGALDEIIVTAQKREQNLKDVPMSVSVLSGQDLADHEADSILDVFDLTVGLDFEKNDDGAESRSTIVTIRGVGSAQNMTGLQPSSTVMVDGEVLSRTSALSGDLVDVQRIEVLRGPQGTLYGKNSSAGVIHTISRRPKLGKSHGDVSFLAAQDGEYRLNGAFNIPMGEIAALRVNGYYKESDGYIENTYPGNHNGGSGDASGGRAQLLIRPSETLSLLFRGDYSEKDWKAAGPVIIGMDDPTHPIISLTNGQFGPDNDTTTIDDTQITMLQSWGVSTEIEKTLGDFTLTYLGYHRDWGLWENTDADKSALGMSVFQFGGTNDSKTTQHELRLTSPEYENFDYILGAYFYDTEDFRDGANQRCTRNPAGATLDPVTLEVIHCRRTDPPYNRVDRAITTISVKNYALFGNTTIRATDRWSLIFGGRFMREKQSLEFEGGRNEIPFFTQSVSDSAFTGRVGAQFELNDSAMLYATYSTGWKGRAFLNTGNLSAEEADPATSPFPLDPEEVEQVEVGLRSVLFDNRMQLNISIYDADFKDFQERVRFEDEDGNLISTLRSIPSVTSKGFEIESVFQFTDSFRVSAAIGYNETIYDVESGLVYGQCPIAYRGTDACVFVGGQELIDLAGETRANAPELSYVISANYKFDLGSSGYVGSFALNHKFKDDVLKGLDLDPNRAVDEQVFTNLNLGLVSPNKHYKLNLFVKNLFDERLISGTNLNPAGNFGGRTVEVLPRNYKRYVGASLTVNFGN